MLEVGGLTAQTGAVVDNFAIDFSGSVIDEGHMALTLLDLLEKTVDIFIGNFCESCVLSCELGLADLVNHR